MDLGLSSVGALTKTVVVLITSRDLSYLITLKGRRKGYYGFAAT